MSGDVQLELYLHPYKMDALSSVLAEQGSSVEKRMQEMLIDLYTELVPAETRQEIRQRMNAEYMAEQTEIEAARKYTAFRVREHGEEQFFLLEHSERFLDAAKFLHGYLRQAQNPASAALQKSFPGLNPITAEQYDQMMALQAEHPNKVTGVFEFDFDRREISTVGTANSWQTYSIEDIASAVNHAYRKSGLGPLQYEARFENWLTGRHIASAGHLSAREISFAEEISEVNNLLNFYMETNFNVDTVFGTQVCTLENDDWINVYANYDMTAGRVCDELEIALHLGDGGEESLTYPLNAVEKETLLRKMDAYCQQQTGQTLADYSAQRMAEDMAPPPCPVM